MIGISESLRGAFMLAKFDKRGLGAFDGTVASARASFRVVWPLIGFYLVMAAIIFALMSANAGDGALENAVESTVNSTIDESGVATSEQAGIDDMTALKVAALLVLSQVISWLGLIALMHALLNKAGVGHRVNTVIATYNWTLFWRKALEALPLVVAAAGIGAGGGVAFLQFAIMVYSLVYLYFSMKIALEGRGFDASLIMFLEIILALMVPMMAFQSDPAAFQAVLQASQG